MRKRDEHLALPERSFSHVFLLDRVAAREGILGPQAARPCDWRYAAAWSADSAAYSSEEEALPLQSVLCGGISDLN